MRKKIIFLVLALGLLVLQSTCGAAEQAAYKITQFHYAVAKDTLQIEIGLNKESGDFSLQADEKNPNQLVLNLKRTKIGSIKKSIALDGKIAEKIEFKQPDRTNGQALISLPQAAAAMKYKVYTMPADRKSNKPFRIVIAIKKAGNAGGFSVGNVNGKTIVLDPGHGGSDSGAVGPDGIMEKDVTLSVAQKVENILEAAGAHVVMTRETDTDVYGPGATDRQELQARVDAGVRTPGTDLFLSIHANSFSNPQAHGTATYYYSKTNYDSMLAEALQNGMVQYGGLADRGTSEANFYVVKHSAMPAALVEMAFVSNPAEEDLLASDDFQEKIARGICQGLGTFFAETGI